MSHVILWLSILTYYVQVQAQLASGICDWTYCLAQVCPLTAGDQGACLCSVNATMAIETCIGQEACTNEEGDDQSYYAGACCSNFHLSKLY